MKMKICRIKSGLPTFPSFLLNMYKIEDRFELDLKRNLLCYCSKWSTVCYPLEILIQFLKKIRSFDAENLGSVG